MTGRSSRPDLFARQRHTPAPGASHSSGHERSVTARKIRCVPTPLATDSVSSRVAGQEGRANVFWSPRIQAYRSGFEPGVQAARALAATGVLLVHMFTIGVATPDRQFIGFVKWDHLTSVVRLDDQHGASAGVFLFFLVSGYIVSQVAAVERGGTFLAKRAARLMPAMIIAVAFAVAVGLTLHVNGRGVWYLFDPTQALTWRSVLEGLGFGAIRPIHDLFPLWTLAVEYYWYLLYSCSWDFVVRDQYLERS